MTETVKIEDMLAKLRARYKEERTFDAEEVAAEREHRKHIERHSHYALIANLNLWLNRRNMHEMPEAFEIAILANTGLQGGDAGHGGELAIRFKTDSGCNAIMLRPTGPALTDRDGVEGEVILTARGDWEQEGLISGLAVLLLKLLEAQHP